MTNGGLRADLIAEIEKLEEGFSAPSAEQCERFGLQPGVPLTVMFGPDVETVLVDKDGINFCRANPDFEKGEILEFVDDDLKKNGAIDRNSSFDNDNFLEIRLKPEEALKLCDNYEHAVNTMDTVAIMLGLSAHGISAHWHMSVAQKSLDCFRSSKLPESYPSPLFKNLVAQILNFQERFPAFFIRPFRAEQKYKTGNYSGPACFAYNNEDARASIRLKHIDSPLCTVEPRISPDDPYHAAYLHMLALKAALDPNEQQLTDSARFYLNYNQQEWFDSSLETETRINSFQVMPIRRGAGGYLEMLEQTAQSLEEFPGIFPPHIARGMMMASIDGYRRYFDENPKAKPNEITNLWGRLNALEEKFSTAVPAETYEIA